MRLPPNFLSLSDAIGRAEPSAQLIRSSDTIFGDACNLIWDAPLTAASGIYVPLCGPGRRVTPGLLKSLPTLTSAAMEFTEPGKGFHRGQEAGISLRDDVKDRAAIGGRLIRSSDYLQAHLFSERVGCERLGSGVQRLAVAAQTCPDIHHGREPLRILRRAVLGYIGGAATRSCHSIT